MSGTRSPSRRAQAIKRSAIIVSHGQPSDPAPAEAELSALTEQVAARAPEWELLSATLAAPGALSAALAKAGPAPVIYPLFMTDGWFIRTLLPKRMGSGKADILAPLGSEPDLPDLTADWLHGELQRAGWQACDTTLIIAAHGSGQSANAARDTNRFAQALATRIEFAKMRCGFIEEAPGLNDVAKDAGPCSICLPFFAASGDHLKQDVPIALDQAGFAGLRLASLGTHPAIPGLIAGTLRSHSQQKVPA